MKKAKAAEADPWEEARKCFCANGQEDLDIGLLMARMASPQVEERLVACQAIRLLVKKGEIPENAREPLVRMLKDAVDCGTPTNYRHQECIIDALNCLEGENCLPFLHGLLCWDCPRRNAFICTAMQESASRGFRNAESSELVLDMVKSMQRWKNDVHSSPSVTKKSLSGLVHGLATPAAYDWMIDQVAKKRADYLEACIELLVQEGQPALLDQKQVKRLSKLLKGHIMRWKPTSRNRKPQRYWTSIVRFVVAVEQDAVVPMLMERIGNGPQEIKEACRTAFDGLMGNP